MIDIVADLHLHGKYSRAVSPRMTLPLMAEVGRQKGLELLATGDWAHPLWLKESHNYVEEAEEGLYKIKHPNVGQETTRFLLSVEIACIYSQNGKGRRIHNLVFVPSFATAEKVNQALIKRGFNLSADGRPIIGMSSKNLLELLLDIDERSLLIPAHAWTPWFGIYGQMSGFHSLSEAFEDLAPYVYAIETGLSSDPEMNWQIRELDTRSIVSFSDAHSAPKMGREATVFQLESLSYENIRKAIMAPSRQIATGDNNVKYTIEFYPEEGKYHYSGHRHCHVTMTPSEQRAAKSICPVCKRKVTDGVMRRVQELSEEEPRGDTKPNGKGIVWIHDPTHHHPPFVKMVPLLEIIAEALKVPVLSPKAKVVFDKLCNDLQSELHVLLEAEISSIEKVTSQVTKPPLAKRVAIGVEKVRKAQIVITPGFDGVYGTVKIWQEDVDVATDTDEKTANQIGLDF